MSIQMYHPPKVEYSFMDYGRSLEPVLQSLCNWGETHLDRINEQSQENKRPRNLRPRIDPK